MIVPEPLVEEKKKKKVIPTSQIQEPDPDPIVIKEKVEVPPVTEEPVVKKRTSRDIVNEMMNTSFPKPTYDPNRPEELKRLARSNAIAKGINLIGDTAGLAMGANVNRRNPDGKEAKYIDDMFKYIDDYDKKEERWNYQNTANEFRKNQLELSQLNTEEVLKNRDRVHADQKEQWVIGNEQRDRQLTNAEKQQVIANEQKDRQLTNAEEQQIISNEQKKQQLDNAAEAIKVRAAYYDDLAKYRSTGGNTSSSAYNVITSDGTEYPFTKAKYSEVRSRAYNEVEALREFDSKLFVPVLNGNEEITGWKLAPNKKDDDVVRAYIEMGKAAKDKVHNPTVDEIKKERAAVIGEKGKGDVVAEEEDDYNDIEY